MDLNIVTLRKIYAFDPNTNASIEQGNVLIMGQNGQATWILSTSLITDCTGTTGYTGPTGPFGYTGYTGQGKRIHHGFISQEVKQLLDKYNIDSGLWIITDTTKQESSQRLRYTELIAPMVKAIQELNNKVESLQSENTHLKTEIVATRELDRQIQYQNEQIVPLQEQLRSL